MLRSGPREVATTLGHETDATELMETGRATERKTNKRSQSPDRSKEKMGAASRSPTAAASGLGASTLSPQDQRAMILLVLLCAL